MCGGVVSSLLKKIFKREMSGLKGGRQRVVDGEAGLFAFKEEDHVSLF